MDIFGSLKKTKFGNKFIVEMKNQQPKLARATLIKKATTTDVGRAFVENCVMTYIIADRL